LIDFNKIKEIYLATGYTYLRKSINGYSLLVQDKYNLSPFIDAMFIFCNRHKHKIKILYWDKTGFWLLYKRLEQGKFIWPKNNDEAKLISKKQLEWLLDGLSIEQKSYHKELNYSYV
jgi:transposase